MAAASAGRPAVSATWIRALDGMQPTLRQTPPMRSRSTSVTVRPVAAARRAAEYPPRPPPTTSRSTPVATSPTTTRRPVGRRCSAATGSARRAAVGAPGRGRGIGGALASGHEELGEKGDGVGEKAGDVLGEGGGDIAVDQAVVGRQ